MDVLIPVAVVLASYLVGSLSFAVIVSRLMGLNDPRSYGSKNPGATNVLRSGSKKAAILTLLLDAVKGWLPVALVLAYGPQHGLGAGVAALAGLAAFLGHLYPVFFGFVGGKGVATAVGVLVGVNGLLALTTVLTFAIVVYFSRYVSLASMVAAVFAPVFYVFGSGVAWDVNATEVFSLAVMALLLVWRHRENINRLLAGTESKLGQKKA
ncbi:glycerol-3-phosphate 1-O-acyltransferase PlsY [Limnohabitans sp.]|jgi:glycerol-3-phosphate acyltransferase PlsY|uniref:glycerol-3-phosphate 1-O-acyltransferase PlsY n=1 Tax=Limnohabitans sp. TaxID=1907725 RepID=UPI001B40A4B3|nr:glycerol-3-phosphate 1-O-acyltransferase PlsY [Limnohabitans sp.]MBP6220432.1 glycerol-3-phosphate 1-O-acyltransferase PlsY [Limnohabitans sp.]MBP6245445.1 glycerol-3-phosphate 1-O-acyltransferase PlsY [Limnohabitans sp.]